MSYHHFITIYDRKFGLIFSNNKIKAENINNPKQFFEIDLHDLPLMIFHIDDTKDIVLHSITSQLSRQITEFIDSNCQLEIIPPQSNNTDNTLNNFSNEKSDEAKHCEEVDELNESSLYSLYLKTKDNAFTIGYTQYSVRIPINVDQFLINLIEDYETTTNLGSLDYFKMLRKIMLFRSVTSYFGMPRDCFYITRDAKKVGIVQLSAVKHTNGQVVISAYASSLVDLSAMHNLKLQLPYFSYPIETFVVVPSSDKEIANCYTTFVNMTIALNTSCEMINADIKRSSVQAMCIVNAHPSDLLYVPISTKKYLYNSSDSYVKELLSVENITNHRVQKQKNLFF